MKNAIKAPPIGSRPFYWFCVNIVGSSFVWLLYKIHNRNGQSKKMVKYNMAACVSGGGEYVQKSDLNSFAWSNQTQPQFTL